MPAYLFRLTGAVEEDIEAVELPDLATVKVEATRLLGELVRDHPERLSSGQELTVKVSDVDGRHCFSVRASLSAE